MMHDFAVTERHAVFMDLPATFDFARMLRGGPFLRYEPDRPSRFGLLPEARRRSRSAGSSPPPATSSTP